MMSNAPIRKHEETIWRESASLILVARNETTACVNNRTDVEQYDYKLLLLKRSERTAMVANQCVFPGGLFESVDESIKWLQYLEEFGVKQQALRQLVLVSEDRPHILAPQGNGCYDRFFKKSRIWAREISLRITALRETFEEVGILLARSRSELASSARKTACAYWREDFDKQYWQKRVHNDPMQFLHLCQQLHVIPDLWSLHEWSAWASPAPVQRGNETVFFITFLASTPNLLIEESEVKEAMWLSPITLMESHKENRLYFMPPQMYEILRLKGVSCFDALLTFAQERRTKGTTLYLPVLYACTDGIVSVFPGDDYYVNDPRSVRSMLFIESTMREFRSKTKRLHRCENIGAHGQSEIVLNFEPFNGHLAPALVLTEFKNKL